MPKIEETIRQLQLLDVEAIGSLIDEYIARYTGYRRSDDDIRCALRGCRNEVIKALTEGKAL